MQIKQVLPKLKILHKIQDPDTGDNLVMKDTFKIGDKAYYKG